MKSKNDNIEKIFKEKLYSFEEIPDVDIWESLNGYLNRADAAKKRKTLIKRFLITSAAAILLVGIAITGMRFGGEAEQNVNIISESDSDKKSGQDIDNTIQFNSEVIETDNIIAEVAVDKTNRSSIPEKIKKSAASQQSASHKQQHQDNQQQGNQQQSNQQKAQFSNNNVSNAADNHKNINNNRASEKNMKTTASPYETQTDNTQTKDANITTPINIFEDTPSRKNTRIYSAGLLMNAGSSGNTGLNEGFQKAAFGDSKVVINGKESPVIERTSDIKYSLPFTFGIQGQFKINNLIRIGIGVNYSLLNSRYDGLINKKMYEIRQTLHYIGVPVNIYFNLLENNNLSLYGNAGGSLEKGIRQKVHYKSYDESISTNNSISGVQYSISGGFGIEFKFLPKAGIYLEPGIVYYFNSNVPASIRTDQPLQIEAEIGLRYHFNSK